MSDVEKLIAAARAFVCHHDSVEDCGCWDKHQALADAAEKELAERIDLEALRKYLGLSKEGWRQMMAQLESANEVLPCTECGSTEVENGVCPACSRKMFEGAKGQPCPCPTNQHRDDCLPTAGGRFPNLVAPKPEAQRTTYYTYSADKREAELEEWRASRLAAQTCPDCNGEGKSHFGARCFGCNGTGKVK